MRYLPLHIKTSFLASLIALTAMLLGFFVFSGKIASQVQDEQRQLATLHAENLAEQLSLIRNQYDKEGLRNLAIIASGSRPSLSNVRIWRIEDGKLIEDAASDDSNPNESVSEEIQATLQKAISSSSLNLTETIDEGSIFRVFAPIIENKKVVGAVEAVEKLDTPWTIALRYSNDLWWILLATVALMTVAFYLLFRRLVDSPLSRLIKAMTLAQQGNLDVELEENSRPNEFTILANKFNTMISQIRQMASEREKRNEILKEKVEEATAELVKQNEEVEAANAKFLRATRKMSEMERLAAAGQTAAQFAHEVGTPLNLISGHAQLLKTQVPPDSKNGQRLNLIAEQIERIKKIVREMLDRTRLSQPKREPLDLNKLLQYIFLVTEPTMEQHRLELSARLAEELPLIEGDADHLQQVFLNLLNNALDAMPDGGKITVTTQNEDGKVILTFADSGSGMREEVWANIFKPLFTTKERGRGTGLGLFVVKQIMQEHEGEISVASELGKGTIFTLKFPAVETAQAADSE